MKHFHFFHAETGVIHPDALAINASVGVEEAALANCPAGHKPIAGNFDHLSQRVDIESGTVVDHQPPQPSPDHEWHSATKRWRLSEAATARREARTRAVEKIAALEAAQHRAVRELLLELVPEHPGLRRLREIEAEIAALRNEFRSPQFP